MAGCILGSTVEMTGDLPGYKSAYIYRNHDLTTVDMYGVYKNKRRRNNITKLIFATGRIPKVTCLDLETLDTTEFNGIDEGQSRRAICNPSGTPCYRGHSNALSLGDCFYDLPNLRTKILHFVRDPFDVIVSGYLYHMGLPKIEEWLFNLPMDKYMNWLMTVGVKQEVLVRLGVMSTNVSSLSYGTFITRMPADIGVVIEGWRALPTVWEMTRFHAFLSKQQNSLQLRFEDWKSNFSGMTDALYEFSNFNVRMTEFRVARDVVNHKCDVWSKNDESSLHHSTFHKANDKEKLLTYICSDKALVESLCSAQLKLGYPPNTCCRT